MEKPISVPRSPEFAIPAELLKMFNTEVRFAPQGSHYGYMIFDRAMLKSILLGNDMEAKKNLVTQLDKMEQAGGKLVIMAG